jgi:hypothetical protein
LAATLLGGLIVKPAGPPHHFYDANSRALENFDQRRKWSFSTQSAHPCRWTFDRSTSETSPSLVGHSQAIFALADGDDGLPLSAQRDSRRPGAEVGLEPTRVMWCLGTRMM